MSRNNRTPKEIFANYFAIPFFSGLICIYGVSASYVIMTDPDRYGNIQSNEPGWDTVKLVMGTLFFIGFVIGITPLFIAFPELFESGKGIGTVMVVLIMFNIMSTIIYASFRLKKRKTKAQQGGKR